MKKKNKYANYSDVYDISFDNIWKIPSFYKKNINDEFREKIVCLVLIRYSK